MRSLPLCTCNTWIDYGWSAAYLYDLTSASGPGIGYIYFSQNSVLVEEKSPSTFDYDLLMMLVPVAYILLLFVCLMSVHSCMSHRILSIRLTLPVFLYAPSAACIPACLTLNVCVSLYDHHL